MDNKISISLTRLEWQVLADILNQCADHVKAAEQYMTLIEKTLDKEANA